MGYAKFGKLIILLLFLIGAGGIVIAAIYVNLFALLLCVPLYGIKFLYDQFNTVSKHLDHPQPHEVARLLYELTVFVGYGYYILHPPPTIPQNWDYKEFILQSFLLFGLIIAVTYSVFYIIVYIPIRNVWMRKNGFIKLPYVKLDLTNHYRNSREDYQFLVHNDLIDHNYYSNRRSQSIHIPVDLVKIRIQFIEKPNAMLNTKTFIEGNFTLYVELDGEIFISKHWELNDETHSILYSYFDRGITFTDSSLVLTL